MRTEFRLKKILDNAGLDKHGRIKMIADGTGISRQTIRKIYHNEARSVSLVTVGRVCEWLDRNALCVGLPGALFAARPSKLLGAMAAPGQVTLYLGEYRSTGFPNFRVARDDAAAASMLVQRLSRHSHDRGLLFRHVHVPSHIPADHDEVQAESFKADKREARVIFRRMRREQTKETSVLIGSQRANYLLEWFVSNLWGCTAFENDTGAVPFYLRYYEAARFPSCFGGNLAPAGGGQAGEPGIYYRRGKNWGHLPSEKGRRGAGVVIVRRDPGLSRLEIAVFGVSAIATAATAKFICDEPDKFWPSEGVQSGLEVGVYLCKFTLRGMETGEEGIDSAVVEIPEIIELSPDLPRQGSRTASTAPRRRAE